MFKKNPARFVGAWLIVLLTLGLIDYAHLHSGSAHPRTSSPAHVSLGVPPAAPSTAKTRTSTSVPPNAHPAAPTPAHGQTGSASATTPAVPAAPEHPAVVPPAPPHVTAPANPTTGPSPTKGITTYVVQPGDTLWSLAGVHLGDPYRWTELFAINDGRHEPGGRVLTDPNLIVTGWTLEIPAGSTGFSSSGIAERSTLGGTFAGMELPVAVTSLSPSSGPCVPTGSLQ
jgi:LysM repeat protein